MARVTLRSGRVQPVWAGHPWVFAQAVDRVDGAPSAGDPVEVLDPKGKHLGRGFYSPKSAIPIRIITRDEDEALDDRALVRRVERAGELRARIGLPSDETDGYRLVHAEGDDLPGLIVDVYRDVAVIQVLTIGMKLRQDVIVGAVARVSGARTVIEARGGKSQEKEGIVVTPGVVRGREISHLAFRERGFEITIELELAQKTGFYFDQRDNRALVEKLAKGRRVLDLYSYVGPFALAAARGGASSVDAYESNAAVVAEAATIAHANGFGGAIAHAQGDVRKVLGKLHERGERYGLVVLDPPKLAPSVRHLNRAKDAYRRLNARALGLLEDGGILCSCSCSGAMRVDELLRTIALAARDAGRQVTLLHMGQQGMDHPVPAAFPEGRYLKCALLGVR
jgi:23S rRNA (cytosine1962-C5)-methyltransferase